MEKTEDYFKKYIQSADGINEDETPTLEDVEERVQTLRKGGWGVHICLFGNFINDDANEMNLQNTLVYLKHVYEYETGKKYKVDYGLDYDKEGNVFVTYTVMPETLEYTDELFYSSREKMLRYTSMNMHKEHMEPYTSLEVIAKEIINVHHNKYKEAFNREYYDAKLNFRDGSALEYPVNLKVDVDVNNLDFNGKVKINEDEYRKIESLTDVFVFETNHMDDDFVANALFKLVRRNVITRCNLDSEAFRNISKEFFGIDCDYDEETQKQFGEVSYIRCMKKRKNNQ